MMWVCSASILGLLIAAGIVLLPSKAVDSSDASDADYDSQQCMRCNGWMRYKITLPEGIRCSCGNVMPLGKTSRVARKVTCPGCEETIHVSPIRKPTRVRCRCGNVANIK